MLNVAQDFVTLTSARKSDPKFFFLRGADPRVGASYHLPVLLPQLAQRNPLVRKGELVAKALTAAWRVENLQTFALTASELDEVTPLLYGSGAAALGWWRVRSSALRETTSAVVLHQAYRLQALQSAIHEQKIEKVFRLMREAEIDAMLAKGWAASRLYPDAALRPYGDIDLLVHPTDFSAAREILARPEAADCWVDLHKSFDEINDRKLEDLFNRSRLIDLGQERVRVLSHEDHLALLCVHLLKHGAWRPLWLCDVGAAVESLPSDFNWDTCLGDDRTRSRWIVCAISLAALLLKARFPDLPDARVSKEIPLWLEDSVLKQWASPFAINQPPMNHSAPMASYLRHPLGVFKAIRERWPNPILATVSINGNFNEFPRLPYQFGNCAMRAAQFLLHLPERIRS